MSLRPRSPSEQFLEAAKARREAQLRAAARSAQHLGACTQINVYKREGGLVLLVKLYFLNFCTLLLLQTFANFYFSTKHVLCYE